MRALRTATAVLVALGLAGALASGCRLATKPGSTGGGTSGDGGSKKADGAKDIEAVKAYLAANSAQATWYPLVESIEQQSIAGVPAIVIVLKTAADADTDYSKDDAAVNAIRASDPAFTDCYITVDQWSIRTERGTAERPALEALPKPTDAASLKSWLEQQYGPGGPRDSSAEAWYGTVKSIEVVNKDAFGPTVIVKTGLTADARGRVSEHTLMGALCSSGYDFAKWMQVQFASGEARGIAGNRQSLPFEK
ncbi:MAG: hypothetical protein FDZ70_05090 [Actinobacteria bacterium]|nr:MAG: hypothetical protein FDZ70_05090 [Actinomycetota bacterium]